MTITFDDFLALEAQTVDTIDVKRAYIDLADGDLVAGVMLSQIIYWHLPKPNGASKLVVHKDGKKWLVKAHADWWNECRISVRQVPRALAILCGGETPLLEMAVWKFNGAPTTHIRLIPENFLKRLTALMAQPQQATEELSKSAQVSKQSFLFTDSSVSAQERRAKARLPREELTPSQLMFSALKQAAHVKRMTANIRGRLNSMTKWMLDNKYTPADIVAFGTWWDSSNWHRENSPLNLDRLESNFGGWVDLGKPASRSNGTQQRTRKGDYHGNSNSKPEDYASDPALVGRARASV